MDYQHIPVLLKEALEFLAVKENADYIDGTLGGGGYTKVILEKNSPNGKVLAFDLDEEAIEHFKTTDSYNQNKDRCILVHSNFSHIEEQVENHGFTNISGIVADIGLSSFQLDQSGRGITFQKREILDMRFDATGKLPTASFLLNNSEESQLKKWFEDYAEEPNGPRIAKEIVRRREKERLRTTEDLVAVIKESLPKPIQHKWEDVARRIFQAMRIAVNHELDSLEEFLPKAFDILSPGGRLIVVSFHSLEDRIVKQFFQKLSVGCVCPQEFPICICGKSAQGTILTRKPITASEDELNKNSRSKSAKLRAIEKI